MKQRSVRLHKLVRLPSKSNGLGESTTSYSDCASCPNSPAVKKAYRLVLVGSARTGKSAIVNRFLDKEFDERYLPTIENFHRKLYKVRGDVYQLDVLDQSGNDPFPAARKLSYITGDLFILVSAVDHAESVEHMLDTYAQIVDCKTLRRKNCASSAASASATSPQRVGTIVPVVFALNKTDLPADKWQVTMDEVTDSILKVVPDLSCFVSCSAARNENITKLFGTLFSHGKLPRCMNPELRRMLRNELSVDRMSVSKETDVAGCGNVGSPPVNPKMAVLQKMRLKFSKDSGSDDEIIIDVNARRPSLRTDLLMNRAISAAARFPSNTTLLSDVFGNRAGSNVTPMFGGQKVYHNTKKGGSSKRCAVS